MHSYFVCFGQTNAKVNTTTDAYTIINKILVITGYSSFEGTHSSGSISGESNFDFSNFSKLNPLLQLDYSINISLQVTKNYHEKYKLRNIRFSNTGLYGTRKIIADWGPDNNPYYGEFYLWVSENYRNTINISLDNPSPPYWRNTIIYNNLNDNQFQEIVNVLSFSNKPINVLKAESEALMKKIIQDSIASKKKFIQDSIASKKKFIEDSVSLDKYKKILGSPIRINNLLVAQFDFPKGSTLENTKKAFEILGNNWRLPTIKELKFLHTNQIKIGGFVNDYYGSSDFIKWDEQILDFKTGIAYNDIGNKSLKYFRAVSTDQTSIIGKPISIENLLVAQYDFPQPMYYGGTNRYNLESVYPTENAVLQCFKLGNGWRLPSKDELNILYQHRKEIGGFEHDYYLSSTRDKYVSWIQNFKTGMYYNDGGDKYGVRAVKDN